MKNLLYLSLITISNTIAAQCSITGPSTIKIDESANYQIENDIAQCKDCHRWFTTGDYAYINSDNKLNNVTVKGLSAGKQTISLGIITANGFIQCDKNIEIVTDNSIPTNQPEISKNCDIDISVFKDAKVDDSTVAFLPTITNNQYKYDWVINYSNGQEVKSIEKIPQIKYNKTGNTITKVTVNILSSKCIREIHKNYDDKFWLYF